MSIFKQTAKAAGEGAAIPIPTGGTHSAVLVAIVDLGTTRDKYADSGKEYDKHAVYLGWELHDEEAKEGGPRFWVGKDYMLAFGEMANLRKLVEGWRGKKFAEGEEFDIDQLLGKPCFLQVVHKPGKSRALVQVAGASRLPKGVQPITPTHRPFMSQVGDGQTIPDWLPYLYGRPLADHIAESYEAKRGRAGAAVGAADEAEVGGEDGDTNPF